MYSSEKTENGHSNSQKSCLQIKQDDKFFNRLLSKESSSSVSNNPSFRVTPVAIPFLWESHPGTPKHPFFSDLSSLAPLTPPPSYFYHNNPTKKHTPRSNLFRLSFSRFNLKKTLFLNSSFSSSLSLSSSSSSSSLDSNNNGRRRRRRRFSSCDSSADLWGSSKCEEDEDNVVDVVGDSRRIDSSCFGFRRSSSFNNDGGFGGCYGRQG